jgi:hypothetical protein
MNKTHQQLQDKSICNMSQSYLTARDKEVTQSARNFISEEQHVNLLQWHTVSLREILVAFTRNLATRCYHS